MIIGQTLQPEAVVYSPWLNKPSSATAMIGAAYLVGAGASGSITVKVFHRNRKDTDSGTAVATVVSGATSTDVHLKSDITGLKEQVRYEVTVATAWCHVALLEPRFYTKKS